MTKEQYQELKDDYINYLKQVIRDFGSIDPMITVFADQEGEEKPAVIHIPIPPSFMKDSNSKDEFVDNVIPELFAEIKQKFNPIGVAWAAEAWVRSFSKDFQPNSDGKKEVVFISIDDKDGSSATVYNIIRNGKQVTAEGDLVDSIELQEDEGLSGMGDVDGRFAHLFSKFDD